MECIHFLYSSFKDVEKVEISAMIEILTHWIME